MEAPVLALNSVHAELLTEVLNLTRYQQTQRIKSIDHCFKACLNRLRDDEVYTGDEVASILTALQDTVANEVRTELRDASHTNGLLLQQLLANAEQWHLTLTADVSELENREKLDMIKDFEDGNKPEKLSITVTQSQQSHPSQDLSLASTLKAQITALEEKNEALEMKLEGAQRRHESQLAEFEDREQQVVSELNEKLRTAHEELDKLKTSTTAQELNDSRSFDLESVHRDIRRMSAELEQSRTLAEEEAEKLRKDLELREDKLRQVQSALLLTEKELDKKFQATSAYANMKKILVQKNTMIKKLRQKVMEAGGNPDSGDEVPCDHD